MDIFAASAASAAAQAEQEAAIMTAKPVVSTPAPAAVTKNPVVEQVPAKKVETSSVGTESAKGPETEEDYVTANFRVPRWVRDRLKMAAALRKTTSVDLLVQWVSKMPDFEALANDIEF